MKQNPTKTKQTKKQRLPAGLGTNPRVRSHSRAPERAARTLSGREHRYAQARESHRAAKHQDAAAQMPGLALSHGAPSAEEAL